MDDATAILRNYWPVLSVGAGMTVQLSFSAILLGTPAGLILGIASSRYTPHRWVRQGGFLLSEALKALPLLVLLMWAMYVLPSLTGLRLDRVSIVSLVLALNLAAYTGEGLRGAIEAVPRAEFDAGLGLGMTPILVFRHIVLPSALRISFPSVFAFWINTIKSSTIGSVVAVPELLHVSNSIIYERFVSMGVYNALAIAFLLVILPLSLIARKLEKVFSPAR